MDVVPVDFFFFIFIFFWWIKETTIMASCAMNLRTISFLADLHKPQYLPVARLCIYIQYSKPVFREHSGLLKNRISWRDQGMLSFMVDALNNKKKKSDSGLVSAWLVWPATRCQDWCPVKTIATSPDYLGIRYTIRYSWLCCGWGLAVTWRMIQWTLLSHRI